MTKVQAENLLMIAAHVARWKPNANIYVITQILLKLQRLAVSLHARYEWACNYDTGEEDSDWNKRTEKIEARAEKLAAEIGIKLEHQRDPRGWPLILTFEGKEVRIG